MWRDVLYRRQCDVANDGSRDVRGEARRARNFDKMREDSLTWRGPQATAWGKEAKTSLAACEACGLRTPQIDMWLLGLP